MKRTCAGLFFACAVVCQGFFLSAQTAASDIPPYESLRVYEEAERFFRTGFWPGAVESYNIFLSRWPDSSLKDEASFNKAVALYNMGYGGDALPIFRKLSEKESKKPFVPYVPYWMGRISYDNGQFEQAAVYLRRASENLAGIPEAADTEKDALLYLARSLAALKEYGEAVPVLERLIVRPDIKKDFVPVAGMLFAAYDGEQNYAASVSLYGKLDMSLLPPELSQHITLFAADAYAALGEKDTAFPLYRSLVSAQDVTVAVDALQKAYTIAENRGDDALMYEIVTDAESVFSGYPDIMAEFWMRMGINSYADGDPETALSCFDRIGPGSVFENLIPLYRSAILYEKSGTEDARASVEGYLGSAGEYMPWYLLLLAQYAADSGDWQKALSYSRELYALTDYNPVLVYSAVPGVFPAEFPVHEALYRHALALYNTGRYEEGLSLVESFPDKISGDESVRLYARLLMKNGRNADAAAVLAPLPFGPASENEDRLLLAQAYLYAGKYREAFAYASKTADSLSAAGQTDSALYRPAVYTAAASAIGAGDWENAGKLFDTYMTAVSRDTDDPLLPFARYYYAYSLYRLGRYADAYTAFSRFLSDSAGTGPVWEAAMTASVCALQAAQGQTDAAAWLERASDMAGRAVTLSGNADRTAQAAILQAGIFADMKEYGKGIAVITPYASGTAPYAPRARYMLGELYAGAGDTAAAEREWQQLAARFPGNPLAEEASYRRGELYYAVSDWIAAADRFASYRRSWPRGRFADAALYFGGESSARAGNPDTAVLLWQELTERFPSSTYMYGALSGLFGLYREAGEYQSAIDTGRKLLDKFTGQARAAGVEKQLDELYLLQSGLEEETAVQLTLFNRSGRARTAEGRAAGVALAGLYMNSVENRGKAVALLEDILEYPADTASAAPAALMLGTYFRETGSYEAAADMLLKAGEYYAGFDSEKAAESLYGAADVFDRLGSQADARAVWETMRKTWPDSVWTKQAESFVLHNAVPDGGKE